MAFLSRKSTENKLPDVLPEHIGFIMDGNGRWAKLRGKPRSFGHIKGSDNVEKVVTGCFERGVYAVTLYAFSTENRSRPKEEVDKILSLLEKFLQKYIKTLVKNEVKLVFSGDLSVLPKSLKNLAEEKTQQTENFTKNVLNIALNYGSRAEIIRACNALIKSGKSEVTEKDFENELYTKFLPEIDLIVRTGGEKRLSNFFMYQAAYAELYFTDVYWPDFKEEELDKALLWFSKRQRRFGNV